MLATRGSVKLWRDDLLGAVDDLSAVIGWARAGSAPRSLPNAYGSLAEAEYRLGVWDDAQAHVDVAVSLAHDSDQVWELPLVHAVAAFLHAGRGDTALADQHVAAAASAAELAPLPLSVYHAAMARATTLASRGEWTGVADELGPLRERVPAGVAELVATRIGPLQCEALVELERSDEAAALLDRLGRERGSDAGEVTGVELWRLLGRLEQLRGNQAEARRAFEAGQDVAARAGSPLAQARSSWTTGISCADADGAARRSHGYRSPAGSSSACGRAPRWSGVTPSWPHAACTRRPLTQRSTTTGSPSASRPSPGWWPRASPTARSARSCSCRPRRSNITSAISSPRSGCAPVTSWRRAWLGVSDPRPAAPPGRGRERCASGD